MNFSNFLYRFDGLSKMLLFYFSFFDFENFLTAFAKNLMKRPPAFIVEIKSSYKLLLSQKGLRSRNFWQWNEGPLNIFKNLYGNEFCLFSLNEKIIVMCNLMIHMKGVADIFFSENWCSLRRPFRNNGLLTFLPKTLWKNCHFLIQICEIHFIILPSFVISNLLLLKWRPFQYNTKFRGKNCLCWCFHQAFVKKSMEKLLFLIQISKVHVRIYCIASFHDLRLSPTKMTIVSM